jgi:transcriptional regulator with XRE-family HTH domain
VVYSPAPAVAEARRALALRLQGIRKDAGLRGAGLARAVGWHRTKVYKIEASTTAPSDADIRTWCQACQAEGEISELIAAARAVETMYVEMRRAARSGLGNSGPPRTSGSSMMTG